MDNDFYVLKQMIQNNFESQIKEENIRRIICSAVEVFSKKSVEATKIKDIALNAGFSQGYIYNYFRSKEELFSKIVELAAEGSVQTIKFADLLPVSAFQKLNMLAYVLTDTDGLSVQHFRLTMMIISSPDSIPGKAKTLYASSALPVIEHISNIIACGQRDGEIIDGNPVTLAISFFSLVYGLLLMKLQAENHSLFPTPEELLNFIIKRKG